MYYVLVRARYHVYLLCTTFLGTEDTVESTASLLFWALLPHPAFLKLSAEFKTWAVSLDTTFSPTIQSLTEFY